MNIEISKILIETIKQVIEDDLEKGKNFLPDPFNGFYLITKKPIDKESIYLLYEQLNFNKVGGVYLVINNFLGDASHIEDKKMLMTKLSV